MTVFHCFRDGKCEWNKGLKDFTLQYNQSLGTSYNLSKCLDVSKEAQKKKQPEVLLESLVPEEQPIVIECKKIVFPIDYYEKHRLCHSFYEEFYNIFHNKIKSYIPQDSYRLSIESDSMYNEDNKLITQKQLKTIAASIGNYIVDNAKNYDLSEYGIRSTNTISWYFHPEPDYRDEANNQSQIIVDFSTSTTLKHIENLSKSEENIINQLHQNIIKIEDKFENYVHCLKILIIELCGDFWIMPSLEMLDNIFSTVELPSFIDEIWLAQPLDDSDEKIIYRRVRQRN